MAQAGEAHRNQRLEISLPKNAIQTATVDRRKEFACNGLLREFYPKGTDLAKVDPFE